MTLSLTWGTSLALPDYEGYTIEDEMIGSNVRTLAGTLRVDQIAYKMKITLRWSGLSTGERSTLASAYSTYAHVATTLTLPDGQAFTVFAVDGYSEHVWYSRSDVPYYDVSIVFREQ